MPVSAKGRLRLTVEGPEPMTVDVEPEDLGALQRNAVEARSRVGGIADTAASRASGQRRYEAVVDGWVIRITVESAERAQLWELAARAATESRPHVGVAVRAQIPGRVVRVWAVAGDSVEVGQRLLAIEAMKMENEVRAPRAGVIADVSVGVGQTVELGDDLVTLE